MKRFVQLAFFVFVWVSGFGQELSVKCLTGNKHKYDLEYYGPIVWEIKNNSNKEIFYDIDDELVPIYSQETNTSIGYRSHYPYMGLKYHPSFDTIKPGEVQYFHDDMLFWKRLSPMKREKSYYYNFILKDPNKNILASSPVYFSFQEPNPKREKIFEIKRKLIAFGTDNPLEYINSLPLADNQALLSEIILDALGYTSNRKNYFTQNLDMRVLILSSAWWPLLKDKNLKLYLAFTHAVGYKRYSLEQNKIIENMMRSDADVFEVYKNSLKFRHKIALD